MSHFMSQSPTQDPEVLTVCLLGIGVVFVGLITLIAIVALSNTVLSLFDKSGKGADESGNKVLIPTTPPTPSTTPDKPIENKQEILAAVCAAIAEENGTDISAIRVISFKKL